MAIFDLKEKTIQHPEWDKDEKVVIREITYAESAQLTGAAMGDLLMGDMEDEAKRKRLKMDLLDMSASQIGTLEAAIVSWTFKRDGKIVPVDAKNISALPGWVGDYIAEEVESLNPKPPTDAEFPVSSEIVSSGKK